MLGSEVWSSMPEPSQWSISVLFRREEPTRFIGSLRGCVPLKKRLKKPPNLLGSVLPKCAHSLKTQDQGDALCACPLSQHVTIAIDVLTMFRNKTHFLVYDVSEALTCSVLTHIKRRQWNSQRLNMLVLLKHPFHAWEEGFNFCQIAFPKILKYSNILWWFF